MDEQREKQGMELLPSLHRKLRQLALEKDKKLWEVVEEAITQYLDGARKAPAEDPDVEMLRRFKAIGSPEDIKFLRGNISVFLRDAERTRRRKGG